MNIKFGHLATWIGVGACFTACAVQRSPEANAPAASVTSGGAKTAAAEAQPAAPESPAAAPAPAPLAAHDGLDAPKSKRARDEGEFSTLEAAERALNQAKADLDRLALAEPPPSVGHDAAADRAAEKKESKPGRAPSAAGAAAATKSSAICEEACRAFASLSRAASAVCRLDGSNGTHCSHAKHVLADAEQRVTSCSCPTSSD